MAKRKVNPDEFVEFWRSATSRREISDRFGITQGRVSVLASQLRGQGEDLPYLKTLKPPPRNTISMGIRMKNGDYETWTAAAAEAAKRLDLPNLTIGRWARMTLNQASRALGIEPPMGPADAGVDRPHGRPKRVGRLVFRTTKGEYDAWATAAEKAGEQLGIPNLTIGPWSRRVLNLAAKALGIKAMD